MFFKYYKTTEGEAFPNEKELVTFALIKTRIGLNNNSAYRFIFTSPFTHKIDDFVDELYNKREAIIRNSYVLYYRHSNASGKRHLNTMKIQREVKPV